MNRERELGMNAWRHRGATVVCACTMLWAYGCASRTVDVQQYGQMHEVLGRGAAAAKPIIALDDAVSEPHAYGVGALAGLEGEISIIDGEVWVARAEGGRVSVDGPTAIPNDQAALLTVAHVNRWSDPINMPAVGDDALEEFIADHARHRGIDTARPFPFVIEGIAAEIQAHVIHGMCPMKPGVHLAADTEPWRYNTLRPTQATIVGFYAADSVGHLTHPGTRIHAHAVFEIDGKPVTAHIERVAIAPGGLLLLPDVK